MDKLQQNLSQVEKEIIEFNQMMMDRPKRQKKFGLYLKRVESIDEDSDNEEADLGSQEDDWMMRVPQRTETNMTQEQ